MARKFAALALCLLFATACWAQIALTFVTESVVTVGGHDVTNKTYVDLSSRHMEGAYSTIEVYSLFDPPITVQGFSDVKWWKNTFQVDCARNVKRVTYIAYLNSDGKTIADDPMPDAPEEPFITSYEGVDSKLKPFVCQQ